MTKPLSRTKKWAISIFVVAWTLLYHYESLRLNYLSRWFGTELPKTKFLFPPAGWIMFYSIEDYTGAAEVWGIKGDTIENIDPHKIYATRWVGYDNIHRGILTHALNPYGGRNFCGYLRRKFPQYDNFAIVQVYYPSVSKEAGKKYYKVVYKCY